MSHNLGGTRYKFVTEILEFLKSFINHLWKGLKRILRMKILKISYYVAQIIILVFIICSFNRQGQFNIQQMKTNERFIEFNKISTRPWLYTEPLSPEVEIDEGYIRFKYDIKNVGISPAFKIFTTSKARFQSTTTIDTLYLVEKRTYKYLFPKQNPITGTSNILYLYDIDSIGIIIKHICDSLDIADSVRLAWYSPLDIQKKLYTYERIQLQIESPFDTIMIDLPQLSGDSILKIIQNGQLYVDIYLFYVYANNDSAFFKSTFGLKYLKQFENGDYFKKGCLCDWIFIDSSSEPFFIIVEDTTIISTPKYYIRS